jgi:rare lipoprotein A
MLRLTALLSVLTILTLNATIARAQSRGIASWYQCCHTTANGERFNPDGLTAAHRTLPFGTKVRVTYRGRSVVVRINDRGPFIKGRIIDLSRGAARKLGLNGTGMVTIVKVK